MENNTINQEVKREVWITRIFDAPRELVFRAWTSPEHLMQWSAPHGCTLEIYQFDFREGGHFRHSVKNPMVRDCLCRGTYLEIVEPEKIVYTISFSDDAGNLVEPEAYGMEAGWPRETTVTVTFEEHDGKTKLTLHQTVPEALAQKTGALPSWLQMLDRLAATL